MNEILSKLFEEAFQGEKLNSLQNLEVAMNITKEDQTTDPLDELENMCFEAGFKSALELTLELLRFVAK